MNNLSDEELIAAIENNDIVVVDFWAEWCGPCKSIAPHIEKLSEEFKGKCVVAKINVDESNIVSNYGIRNVPTVLFFSKGDIVNRVVGTISYNALRDQLCDLINE